VCERERERCRGSFGGCIHAWVEFVFSGQANIVRDSLSVGSENKIILAIKNQSYIHHEKDM
jgi:hypothetical protein